MLSFDLIFFGIQGSGKGTQAARVADNFDLNIFEMGAELRRLSQTDSDLGKKVATIIAAGDLVSDEVVMEIVEQFINKLKPSERVLFDGIPRTIKQGEMLRDLTRRHNRQLIGLFIDVSEECATERLLLRKRSDDTPDSIKKRFANYRASTLPVINTFAEEKRLIHCNGDQTMDEVTNEIISKISSYDPKSAA